MYTMSTKTRIFSLTFRCFAIALMLIPSLSNAQKNLTSLVSPGCTGFRTQTQGGWGADAHGGNSGVYRDAHFAAAFPNGLTIGCAGGNTLKLTSAVAVNAFLPSGTTPSVLPVGNLVDPGGNYSNVLAGQLVTAVLNVGFDLNDASFSSNTINTGDLIYKSGTFAGKTVNQVIAIANDIIGGCSTAYGADDLNVALTSFNENYDNGTVDNGNFSCTPTCNISVNGTYKDITCHGENNGSIDITVSGANGAVTYLWNDVNTSEDRSGLAAGTYSVTAKDAAGCSASKSFEIKDPVLLTVGETHIDVTVVNGTNGSINITAKGGTAPYTYLWSDGSTSEDRTGLAAGSYSVTVTDAHHCTTGATVIISGPDCKIGVTGKGKDITCHDDNNGSIDISVTNATGNVTYLWSDGSTDADRSGLSAGSYSVTVKDDAGCTASESFTIQEPSVIDIKETHVNVSIVNGSDGSIDITVTGGTGSYTYLWSDGSTDGDRSGLPAGDYSVTVTDANGCSRTLRATVYQPQCQLEIDGSSKDITCNGSKNGTIDVTVSGNNGAVSYLWNDGSTDEDRSGLAAGDYTVEASTANGCKVSKSFTIIEPLAIGVTETHVDITKVDGTDGSVDITVTGGTKPYQYLWNDGSTDEDRTGLKAGDYSLTVTDASGCSNGIQVTLKQPQCSLYVSGKVTNVCCYGANTGAIDITATGNNGIISYLWNDGATSEDRTNLIAGAYSVAATDEAGCKASASFTITQPKKLKVVSTVTNTTGPGKCDGTAQLSASGGQKPYTFKWSDGYVGATRSNLCKGTYTVTVTDKIGCTATCKIKILCGGQTIAAASQVASEQSVIKEGEDETADISVTVSPNPTKGIVKVAFKAIKAGNASVAVYDMNGRIMQTQSLSATEGMNYKQLDLSKYTRGTYNILLMSGNERKSVMIILDK